MTDYLKPPWGLPPADEARLAAHLTAKEWGAAVALLRESTSLASDHVSRLLALAESVVNDALATTPDAVGRPAWKRRPSSAEPQTSPARAGSTTSSRRT